MTRLEVGRVMVAFAAAVTVSLGPLAYAQPAPGATTCQRPPQECQDPWSLPGLVAINLRPNAAGACQFEPRLIDDLETDLGGDVNWLFCSTCDVDMTVQMDTGPDGPFDNFRIFSPMPAADNLVTFTVPCQGDFQAYGRDAEDGGVWKYSLRTRPATPPGVFTDEIDPKLEIDEYRGYFEWLIRMIMVALGASAGVAIARRRRSTAGR